ncbi:MAG TPA: SAM-dependent methyltransferase, partial [Paenibacillus sp.]|nr:SAM-dependent methyltransferase [Paenibacillus sp.]
VTGVDISEKMLAMARKRPEIRYIQGSMEEIEFNSNEFDLLVS